MMTSRAHMGTPANAVRNTPAPESCLPQAQAGDSVAARGDNRRSTPPETGSSAIRTGGTAAGLGSQSDGSPGLSLRQPNFDGTPQSLGEAATPRAAGSASAIIGHGRGGRGAGRSQVWERKRRAEAAYREDVKARGKVSTSKARKLSKRESEVEALVLEAKKMYDAKDGKKVVQKNLFVKRLLAEQVITACAARGDAIDFAVASAQPVLRPFPGLATLVAVTPKVDGFKPSEENNPNNKVYKEGIKPLGHSFLDPIIQQVICTTVRRYKVYSKMIEYEDSQDPDESRECDRLWEYLHENCSELLAWKYAETSRAKSEVEGNNPLIKMLKFMEKISTRTRSLSPRSQEGGKTLNGILINNVCVFIAKENAGQDPIAHGLEKPDPVLYAVIRATYAMLFQGLKHLTDTGRHAALELFSRKIGIVCFKIASSDDDSFQLECPRTLYAEEGADDGEMELFSSGLEKIPAAKTFLRLDEHKCRPMMPESVDDLHAMLTEAEMKFNRIALKKLKRKEFPGMKAKASYRKIVLARGRKGFDTASCSRMIDIQEDRTKRDPEGLRVIATTFMHVLAADFLCKYLDIDDPAVLLAVHEKSLSAVHAVALSIFAIIQTETCIPLCPMLEGHKGPMTALYRTKAVPTLIGLTGVKKFPSEDLDSVLDGHAKGIGNAPPRGNDFDEELKCLNAEYQNILKDIMFISPQRCREIAPNRRFSFEDRLEEDSDASDYEQAMNGDARTSAAPVEDDDINEDMAEMEYSF